MGLNARPAGWGKHLLRAKQTTALRLALRTVRASPDRQRKRVFWEAWGAGRWPCYLMRRPGPSKGRCGRRACGQPAAGPPRRPLAVHAVERGASVCKSFCTWLMHDWLCPRASTRCRSDPRPAACSSGVVRRPTAPNLGTLLCLHDCGGLGPCPGPACAARAAPVNRC